MRVNMSLVEACRPFAAAETDAERRSVAAAVVKVLGECAQDQAAADLGRFYVAIAKASAAEDEAEALEAFRGVPVPDSGLEPALPRPVARVDVGGKWPEAVLSVPSSGGQVVSVGASVVLAGPGGIGKSALALTLARDVVTGRSSGRSGLFEVGASGPVLYAGYEDPPEVVAWRAGALDCESGASSDRGEPPLDRGLQILDLRGWPLYGPPRSGLYNARPGPLPGWRALEAGMDAVRPRLVIIDPALGAYVGDGSGAAPVREFLAELERAALPYGAGVLVIQHTTKAARHGGRHERDPLDPGAVSGSTHWTDAPRAALSFEWRPTSWGGQQGDRVLGIAKANWACDQIAVPVSPVRRGGGEHGGAIVGFRGDGKWRAPREFRDGEADGGFDGA